MNPVIFIADKKMFCLSRKSITIYNISDCSFFKHINLPNSLAAYGLRDNHKEAALLLEGGQLLIFNIDYCIILSKQYDLNEYAHFYDNDVYNVHYSKDNNYLVVSGCLQDTEYLFLAGTDETYCEFLRVQPKEMPFIQRNKEAEVIVHQLHGNPICLPASMFREPIIPWTLEEDEKGIDFSGEIRFVCLSPSGDRMLATFPDTIMEYEPFYDRLEIQSVISCYNPRYAIYSKYSDNTVIVVHKDGALSVFKNDTRILFSSYVTSFEVISENLFVYCTPGGIHVVDLNKAVELYLLPIEKENGDIRGLH